MSPRPDPASAVPPVGGVRRIFLVGARGSGKTTVGRALAERVGLPFADTDELVATLSGVLVGDLLRKQGEGALRAVESVVLDRLCAGPDRVVATGGGAILSEKNRARMRASGTVVYLRADAGVLEARIRSEGTRKRPSLTGAPPDEEVGAVLASRARLYEEVAHLVVDAAPAVDAVAAAILAALSRLGAGPPRRDPPRQPPPPPDAAR